MPLKTFVKVGSITNLSDARYCAGMGVNMLGFTAVEGQDNYISPAQFQEIRGWITGPLVVAEIYGIQTPGAITGILENYKPDYLEMGLTELALFSTLPLPLLLFLEEGESTSNFGVSPEYLLSRQVLDTKLPNLVEIRSKSEVAPLLGDKQVSGFILHGSAELRPGLKNIELMADVLELLEVED